MTTDDTGATLLQHLTDPLLMWFNDEAAGRVNAKYTAVIYAAAGYIGCSLVAKSKFNSGKTPNFIGGIILNPF